VRILQNSSKLFFLFSPHALIEFVELSKNMLTKCRASDSEIDVKFAYHGFFAKLSSFLHRKI
jgi:hypothetical protein